MVEEMNGPPNQEMRQSAQSDVTFANYPVNYPPPMIDASGNDSLAQRYSIAQPGQSPQVTGLTMVHDQFFSIEGSFGTMPAVDGFMHCIHNPAMDEAPNGIGLKLVHSSRDSTKDRDARAKLIQTG